MPQPAQQIRFCTSRDGTRIAYATCGSGPPLVWVQHWVHHLDLDWEHPVWRPWLSFLSRRYTVVRYDWRGCGLSDHDGLEYSTDRYGDDLAAVIAAAGLERAALFGMAGSGSAAAIFYAGSHPARISRLIVSGGQAYGRLARNPTPAKIEESKARLKVYELGWSRENPAYGQFFTALHIPDGTTEQMRAYDELLRRTTSPDNAVRLVRSFQEMDIEKSISSVQCPTLVLHSRGDCITPFEDGRRIATLLPDARFVPLESRNHILLESEPAWLQLVAAVEDFLPGVTPQAGHLPLDELTAREREILEAVAQGLNNDGIAERLKISEKTVRNHVSTIMSKLGVNNRPQAIVWAREAGFGQARAPTHPRG